MSVYMAPHITDLLSPPHAVNAADNKQRDKNMNAIKIVIDP